MKLIMKTTPVTQLLFAAFGLAVVCGTEHSSYVLWKVETQQLITVQVTSVRVRSAMDCARQCQNIWNGTSCSYNSSEELCYLLLTQPSAPESLEHELILNNAPVCHVLEAPSFPKGQVTTWRTSPTSLDGDVSCDSDYMLSNGDDTWNVRCLATGEWQVNGECKQRVWRNNSALPEEVNALPLPRPAEPGWSMCLNATPTNSTWFHINLQDSDGNILHVKVILNFGGEVNRTKLISVVNNNWTDVISADTPFPFVVGEQFSMEIRASSVNYFFVYVNGNFYANRTTLLTVDQIDSVYFRFDVQVHFLDLWCSAPVP